MRPRVLLFDIDGTLVDCGGAGRRAMERGFADRVGRSDVLDFGFGGMTDRAIARQGLRAAGLEPAQGDIDALVERYLVHLEVELARAEGFRVLAGVTAMLDSLDASAARAEVAVGLGTGNVAAGAELKLARGGLSRRFGFGGYGCDAEDRAALLRQGAERGAARLGRALDAVEIVVVGDTPRDVHAGQAIGARVLAVSTGRFDAAALRAAGADEVLASLASPAAVALLCG